MSAGTATQAAIISGPSTAATSPPSACTLKAIALLSACRAITGKIEPVRSNTRQNMKPSSASGGMISSPSAEPSQWIEPNSAPSMSAAASHDQRLRSAR